MLKAFRSQALAVDGRLSVGLVLVVFERSVAGGVVCVTVEAMATRDLWSSLCFQRCRGYRVDETFM